MDKERFRLQFLYTGDQHIVGENAILLIYNAKEISLEEKEVRPIVDQLNDLLANYHIHYQKLRGCHWNVKGSHFFTLHVKFEELYTNAQLTIDELAERILTLGKSPYSTFTEYIRISKLKEINTIGMKDTDMVLAIRSFVGKN